MSASESNRRIAKNTLLLYFRMIGVSLVSLFTTRLVLQYLGVEDFGIFNVVGGIVGFLGLFNGSMTSATQRFLSFELGGGDVRSYSRVFSMLLTIFIALSLILLIVAVFIGPWLIRDYLVIPAEKRDVAILVYYFSVLTFFISLIAVPYTSSIIAHERMGIYAVASFIEVILKLFLVYLLYVSPYDSLLTYGFLSMCVALLVTLLYCFYCIKRIEGSNYQFFWEKALLRKLLGYIGWNLFGSVTTILNNQGQTLVLNLFFGPLINAAKAISDRIFNIVGSFSNNFFMAVRPQIIKAYASGKTDDMFELVNKSSKFSFYLLFVITLPLILSMKNILTVWLGENQVTGEMIVFSQLMLIFSLVNVFESPITTMIQATGDIRKYQIAIGSGTLLLLPICYYMFRYGLPAYYSVILLICIYTIAHLFRLLIAHKQLGFSVSRYCNGVLAPVLLISLPSSSLSYLLCGLFPENFIGLICSILASLLSAATFVFLVGLDKLERDIVMTQIGRTFRLKNAWKVKGI